MYAYTLHRFTRLPVYPDPVDNGVSTSGTYSRAAILGLSSVRVKDARTFIHKTMPPSEAIAQTTYFFDIGLYLIRAADTTTSSK